MYSTQVLSPSVPDQARQFDHPLNHPYYKTLPQFLPGVADYAADYIYFSIPQSMRADLYDVVVETTSPLGGTYRKFARLSEKVRLPEVHFPAHAKLLVLPRNDPRMPRFLSEMVRGSTYVIPAVRTGGLHQMSQHGVQ